MLGGQRSGTCLMTGGYSRSCEHLEKMKIDSAVSMALPLLLSIGPPNFGPSLEETEILLKLSRRCCRVNPILPAF
jgi:hypothetical protein